MPSSTAARSRKAPPVRPSKSLEGLEIVVPPGTFFTSRSDLSLHKSLSKPDLSVKKPLNKPDLSVKKLLNKPLPAIPLPDPPPEEASSLYSRDSIIDGYISPTRTESSTEGFLLPIASEDEDEDDGYIDDLATPVTAPASTADFAAQDKASSLAFKSFLFEERYGLDNIYWAQARFKNSPYFREKKLDFFPELAISSGLQAARFPRRSARRKLDAVVGLRDSIRSYVERTISRNSTFEKFEKGRRALWSYPQRHISSRGTTNSDGPPVSRGGGLQHGLVDVYDRMHSLSLSSGTGSDEDTSDSRLRRRKQRAVSMTPYQRYGPKIWETPRRPSRTSYPKGYNVTFPKHPKKTPAVIQTRECPSSLTPTSPQSTSSQSQHHHTREYVKALHDGTNHVLSALDGAKRKIAESKMERRRMQLKKQIRVVGPTELSAEKNVSYWV